MYIRKKHLFCALQFFLIGLVSGYGQEKMISKADKEYNNYAYIDASKIYLEVANKGFKSEELFQKLGNSLYFNSNYTDAEKWYGELFSLNENQQAEYILRYSQSLLVTGKENKAKAYFDKYLEATGKTDKKLSSKDYKDIIESNADRYELEKLNINSTGIDFGTALSDDKLIFASTRADAKNKIDPWTELSYLDLYEATINADGTMTNIITLPGDVNTKYHESTPSITKDGKTMYFTRTADKLKANKKENVHNLKIMKAELKQGKWTNVQDLSINDISFSNSHPALSPDGKTLYFVSNRPGGFGQTDIYAVNINDDGSLGTPKNLGAKVNTLGRESFPFVSENNDMYFSSDGHYRLGGYDVFYVSIDNNGEVGEMINLGEPINSKNDDFCFVIKGKKGYISSNRDGGVGYDDVYGFTEVREIQKVKVSGAVVDADSKQPLQNATIRLVNKSTPGQDIVAQTDAKGYYETEILRADDYLISAVKAEYEGDDVFSKSTNIDRVHNFELKKNTTKATTGTDIAEILNIIIYFDLDKYNIRPDAQVELEKIVAVLNENPNLNLSIRSHTDSRASDSYNMVLSNNRANATLDYIVKQGISKSRLTAKGYGETQLVNQCSNGVTCTEAEHQLNRRSQFIVVE